jgi:hypothetical protein
VVVTESPDTDRHRTWHFKQLKWSVQALALRAPEQLVLFPDFVATADELALELDHWATLVLEKYPDQLADQQAETLRALHHKLETMSRDGAEFDADLWSETAMGTSVHWQEVRALAIAARDIFGWSADVNPEEAVGSEPSGNVDDVV